MARLTALVVLFGALAAGCDIGIPCDRSEGANPIVDYRQGSVLHGVYSSEQDGKLLYYPGGMRYRLHHHLGETPRWVQAYLSFDEFGTVDGGVLAPAAGNQFEISEQDAETITIVNDSCVEYWLAVQAGTGDPSAGP